MRIKNILFIFLLIFCQQIVNAQKNQKTKDEFPLTNHHIWGTYDYWQNSVYGIRWMKNGQYYTQKEQQQIVKKDILSGETIEILFDGRVYDISENEKFTFRSYAWSHDESKMLLKTNVQRIYRHSTKADFFIYDIKTKKLTPLSQKGSQMYATFSPDGQKVCFVRDNNIFIVDLISFIETQLTFDGEHNQIINGATDWVYEEEFSFARAFQWSPLSNGIAFYRFDESEVPEYNMQVWGKGLYPQDSKFKYPKAGDKNSEIKIMYYDLATGKTSTLLDETGKDSYIPRIKWTKQNHILSIQRLNRFQNKFELIHVDVKSLALKVVYLEENNTYVEITDNTTYLKDEILITSEKEGYRQAYLLDYNGKIINKITEGEWEIDKVIGVDEKSRVLYFTSTEVSPLERYPYAIGLNGNNKVQLVSKKGTNTINMSPDFQYFLNYNSTINRPLMVDLFATASKTKLKTLEENTDLNTFVKENCANVEFFKFKNSSNQDINGWMIKPRDFKVRKKYKKKYPVLMYVYGGPGHQTVKNEWMNVNFFWYQMLADKGYIIVSIDNRGTGGRGTDFKKSTYGQLGKLETRDQMEAAGYLANLPYVNENRIGIWGWSYGGYMSSLCITIGHNLFKMAIAVAPVTNWRYYDSIYTERYLQTPEANPKGYDKFSPMNYADRLKGKYLLIHGTGDDNVHFQNAIRMQNALIKAGKQFDSFYYPDRNHGIYGGNTRKHLYDMMTNYIYNNL